MRQISGKFFVREWHTVTVQFSRKSNSAMGFYQSMNSLGSIFGALFAGLIYDANPMLPFILAFAAFVVAMFFSVMYVGKYKKEKSQNA